MTHPLCEDDYRDRRQIRWRLTMPLEQRVAVNRKMYRLWVIGQRNRARRLAAARRARGNAA